MFYLVWKETEVGRSKSFEVVIGSDEKYKEVRDRLFACGAEGKQWNITRSRGGMVYRVTTTMPESAKEAFLHSSVTYHEIK
jgi:hypothetical protein